VFDAALKPKWDRVKRSGVGGMAYFRFGCRVEDDREGQEDLR
jgi:hypothetical protein